MHHSGGTDWESAVMGHPKRRGATYADSKLAMVIFAKVRKFENIAPFFMAFLWTYHQST